MGGRERADLIAAACELLQVSETRAAAAVDVLVDAGLLEAEEGAVAPYADRRQTWEAHGWTAAHDYHLATWDYPFVDYDVDGWTRDRTLMATYDDVEADVSVWVHDRCSHLAGDFSLPPADEALETLTAPVGHLAAGSTLSAEKLTILLASTFGRLPPRGGAKKPRRSSPSGGAQHPVEGYIVNLSVPGIDRGVWHIRGRDNDLVRIASLPGDEWLTKNLSGLFRAAWTPEAVVVFTAVFARNMYRYREPRTLRTIFLDTGHLIATLETAAAAQGIASFAHHGMDDPAVEQLLGLTGLREGAMAGVGLAGGVT